MIHRDLCDPTKTKNYSPLRMQFHFVLSRYVCWDGFIPLTRREIAELLSCNIQSIDKFIKKGVLEGILSLKGDRLFLLKKVDEYTEGYVKHYPFLESSQFQSLSVHAQRFILYTLWAGVHSGRPLKRNITALYHSSLETCGVLNLYSKAPVYVVLEQAKTFLELEIIQHKGKEMIRVTGLRNPFVNQQALENQGELKLLENILEDHNCDELVSMSSCEEILKLKKHYTSTLNSIGMELFSHALKKLLSLHKLYDLNTRGEIGIYLRSIINDLEQKILPTIQKRMSHCKQAIERTKDLLVTSASQWIKRFKVQLDELTQAFYILLSKQKQSYDSHILDYRGEFPFFNWLGVK